MNIFSKVLHLEVHFPNNTPQIGHKFYETTTTRRFIKKAGLFKNPDIDGAQWQRQSVWH